MRVPVPVFPIRVILYVYPVITVPVHNLRHYLPGCRPLKGDPPIQASACSPAGSRPLHQIMPSAPSRSTLGAVGIQAHSHTAFTSAGAFLIWNSMTVRILECWGSAGISPCCRGRAQRPRFRSGPETRFCRRPRARSTDPTRICARAAA